MTTPIDQSSLANAAALAAQGASSRRLDASLSKLTAAKAVKPTPTDAATVTSTNVLKAVRDAAPLRELGARLIDLRKLLAGSRSPNSVGDAQAKIDASLASIRKVAASLRGAPAEDPLSPVAPAPNAIVTNVDGSVDGVQVTAPDLGPGQSLDVNVLVTQSAQTAALALSFGGRELDLGATGGGDPNARFDIEIAGSLGKQTLSFASGTTLHDVAETINLLKDTVGVSASVSGTALRLDSLGLNDESYVSVRVIDDGGIQGVNTGVYTFLPTDNYTADWSTRTSFAGAESGIVDHGQDLAALVNGVLATNRGDTGLYAVVDGVKVSFDLSISLAQSGPNFPFRAFTIVGQGGASAVDRVASLDPKLASAPETISLLDDAIREVERAERERLLGRADEGLTLDEVDAPVIREAQAKLLEEARRLGLLIDHDPAKAIDALRD